MPTSSPISSKPGSEHSAEGGRIAGEIAHRDERLAAMERLESRARDDAGP